MTTNSFVQVPCTSPVHIFPITFNGFLLKSANSRQKKVSIHQLKVIGKTVTVCSDVESSSCFIPEIWCNKGCHVYLWRSLPFTENNQLTIVVVVIVGLLAVAAIVISAISIARNGGAGINIQQGVPSGGSGGAQTPIVVNTGGSATNGGSPSGSTIFLLATGHDFGAHAYL